MRNNIDRYPSYKNHEGYLDPTAHNAISNVIELDTRTRKRVKDPETKEEAIINEANFLLRVIKYIIRNSGFECVSRIELKHKASGRIFR